MWKFLSFIWYVDCWLFDIVKYFHWESWDFSLSFYSSVAPFLLANWSLKSFLLINEKYDFKVNVESLQVYSSFLVLLLPATTVQYPKTPCVCTDTSICVGILHFNDQRCCKDEKMQPLILLLLCFILAALNWWMKFPSGVITEFGMPVFYIVAKYSYCELHRPDHLWLCSSEVLRFIHIVGTVQLLILQTTLYLMITICSLPSYQAIIIRDFI